MSAPRTRNAIEFQDVVAATFVVGNDLHDADFLTLAEAIANLPDNSRSIYCLTPETVTSSIVLPDGDLTITWADAATFSYSGVAVLFQVPNGLTDFRRYYFIGGNFDGGGAVGQTFVQLSDVNSYGLPYFMNCKVRGARIVVDITAGDTDYIDPVFVRFIGGLIESPDSSSTLAKTPNAAGSFAFGSVVKFDGTNLSTEGSATNGWTIDFDGDLILDDILALYQGGTCACDGLQINGSSGIYGFQTFTVNGANYWANNGGHFALGNGSVLKVPDGKWDVVNNGGTIQVNGASVEVHIVTNYVAAAAVAVDILSGSDYALVTGRFADHATASIRTAAKYGSFSGCRFTSTGAHKTVLELAGADFNIATGCTPLHAGGGVTVVGANSLYDVTLANVA